MNEAKKYQAAAKAINELQLPHTAGFYNLFNKGVETGQDNPTEEVIREAHNAGYRAATDEMIETIAEGTYETTTADIDEATTVADILSITVNEAHTTGYANGHQAGRMDGQNETTQSVFDFWHETEKRTPGEEPPPPSDHLPAILNAIWNQGARTGHEESKAEKPEPGLYSRWFDAGFNAGWEAKQKASTPTPAQTPREAATATTYEILNAVFWLAKHTSGDTLSKILQEAYFTQNGPEPDDNDPGSTREATELFYDKLKEHGWF